MGIDPGKNETWWAAVKRRSSSHQLTLHVSDTGRIDLSPETEINQRLPLLYSVVNNLIKTTIPDLVVAERFVVRPGRGRGNVSEIVNQFLGVLYCVCARRHCRLALVMPSVHKTWLRKRGIDWPQLNPHEHDAASLASYGYHLALQT